MFFMDEVLGSSCMSRQCFRLHKEGGLSLVISSFSLQHMRTHTALSSAVLEIPLALTNRFSGYLEDCSGIQENPCHGQQFTHSA